MFPSIMFIFPMSLLMGHSIHQCYSTNINLAFVTLVTTSLLTVSFADSDRPLEGKTFRCCTIIERPVVYEARTGKHAHSFSGIAIDYLTILEDRLGFRCAPLVLFKAHNPENQGFTGFVYEMEECTRNGTIIKSSRCQCDIGVGGWVRNQEREGLVDFLPTYVNDDFRMLTSVDNIDFHSTSSAFFITAFSLSTWVAIFGLIACFIFLKLFDKRFPPPDPRLLNLPNDAPWYSQLRLYLHKTRFAGRLTKATKNSLLEVIGQTNDTQTDSQTSRQWFLTYIILLCGLFLVLAYEARMTASLVQEAPQSQFRNVDDLKSCRVPAHEVCVPAGGAAYAYWQDVIATSPCNRGGPQPRIVNSYDEGHQKVASNECKFFLASGATTKDAAHGRYCGQVKTTGEPFFVAGLSSVLPKDSNLTKLFSNVTLELIALGAVDSIDQYVRRNGECETGGTVSLTFERLKIFFITAFSACAFMFLVMLGFPQGNEQEQNTRDLNTTKSKVELTEDIEPGSESSASIERV